jgi:hypothetical protein
MQYRPDIVISDPSGAAAAIVEVKALRDADLRDATRYLRNLLAHGVVPHARFALLITPEMGYLWSTPAAVLEEALPALTFPMDQIVQHYLPEIDEPTPVRGLVLESIVRQWLLDLADGITIDDSVTRSLRAAGFLDAVQDGQVTTHAPV